MFLATTGYAKVSLSTGIFRFSMDLAAKIMIQTVRGYLSENTGIQRVVFSLFDEKEFIMFKESC